MCNNWKCLSHPLTTYPLSYYNNIIYVNHSTTNKMCNNWKCLSHPLTTYPLSYYNNIIYVNHSTTNKMCNNWKCLPHPLTTYPLSYYNNIIYVNHSTTNKMCNVKEEWGVKPQTCRRYVNELTVHLKLYNIKFSKLKMCL